MRVSLIFHESEEYVEMNKVNEYILNDVRTSNDKLIWCMHHNI